MATAVLQPVAGYSDAFKSASIEVLEREATPELDLETQEPRTIDELIKLRARQSGCDDPIISYPDEGTTYIDYSPKDLDRLVEQAAHLYSNVVPQRMTSNDPVQVVGLLGDSDLSYLIALLAISRLGHTALLLSTRITDEAYESLLSATKATALIYQSTFKGAERKVLKVLPQLNTASIVEHAALADRSADLKAATLDPLRETKNGSFIIHSSGSTGLPKPIYQTHSASLYTYSQHFSLVGHLTLPLYHNHGICCTFRAIHSRRKIYLYNARLPLASSHLLATLREHPDIKILYGVPYALKLLAETEEGSELLSRLDIVMFGGSACPKPVGDSLVRNGVNLVGHYGATEVGQLMTSFRDFKSDKLWDWLRVPEKLLPYLSMELRGPNLYECCVKQGWGSKVATNRDDGSYATKDLFTPHPTVPNAWQYYARLDDTIVLENGEKANPLLVEGVLRHNRNVAEAVVFGAGKPRLGAFIIPKPDSDLTSAQVIDSVVPAIEEMNKALPAYSHLSKDMIKTLPHDADYRRTDKGTVIRAAFYRDFAKQIDQCYIDEQSGSLRLERDELIAFLRKEFTKRLAAKGEVDFSDDTDLFSLGVDSLQAIQIRSVILKTNDLKGSELGRNFVFDFPTLTLMANEILRLQTGEPQEQKASIEDRMAAMIKKYSDFDRHQPIDRKADGDYIVVTGATGSLGAHVVARLASQHRVRKVYCLVRASSTSNASARVEESLRLRRVHDDLSLESLQKIIALPSDFSNSLLGLEWRIYDGIAKDITHLLHLAWSVNFNKNLESFESDCIAGAKNLIDLCLKAKRPQPATFNFCSSVSATVRTPGGVVPEALPESFSYAQGMGYAQSKHVTEHLCDRATKSRGIKARVLRVGQVIGDTKHGVWNATEAIPMILQTAKTVGALPKLDERPSWLPVDVVAQTFVDIGTSDTEKGLFNLVNHGSFHWAGDLLPLLRAAGVEFEEVGQREWIRRLRASNPDPEVNPPIKLVDFFAGKYDNDDKKGSLSYDTTVAQECSEALREVGVLDQELVGKIVAYLKSIGSL
ncbi:Adenylate-forming reductase Nps10 [Fulvia fulva]|uniref:Adenylate-forming reductase Nps10 n=1 Tax=Passalora fulva TaxID=5499 RepID=A0A9Q8PLE1_PASFU|nr:Adenylate-forming reductase Nps10 [Fulvia fulva]KAK4610164.1 Adenylate-forming reductase Nps10 [Fulvia fulva]KAK4611393.1 Adenylate-forming reductase Nps10 [Fulvia fulva]UJO24764.1 Adenylate-forming reductase Nps10 [Fulvia fulva]WPV22235.1 Adenylate-forming reductase Nps10 [Fulvia fulva]WPV37061.1 Adenylate-forming reductase Nps10 [Fulvia fulva]